MRTQTGTLTVMSIAFLQPSKFSNPVSSVTASSPQKLWSNTYNLIIHLKWARSLSVWSKNTAKIKNSQFQWFVCQIPHSCTYCSTDISKVSPDTVQKPRKCQDKCSTSILCCTYMPVIQYFVSMTKCHKGLFQLGTMFHKRLRFYCAVFLWYSVCLSVCNVSGL